MKAKKETIVTLEFTIRDDEFKDYDIGVLCNAYHPMMRMVCADGVRRLFPDADHNVVKAQSFLHEPRTVGKTYQEDLLEKLPMIARRENGTPCGCRDTLYDLYVLNDSSCVGKSCLDCWNEIMPDQEAES